jgi:hypothetical protein
MEEDVLWEMEEQRQKMPQKKFEFAYDEENDLSLK